jgi:O-antigen/teichoic acid export membrane protein
MDKRRFIINFISNFFSALSGVGISFFLTPYIVEHLGKEAYGFYPLAFNFVTYAGVITTALNSMSGRYITISLEQKKIHKVNVYFNSVLFGNLIISLILMVMSAAFCLFINYLLDIPSHLFFDVRLLFVFIFISLVINVSSAVFSVSAFALNRFDKQAIITIISNIIKLGVIIVLFYFFTPKIMFLGLSAVATAVYMLVANYRLTKKMLPEVVIGWSYFSKTALFTLVGSGIWNSVIALSIVVNTQLDLLLANHFFGASEMGFLSLTKFIPNIVYILLGMIVPIFLPEMLKSFAQRDMNQLKNTLRLSFKAIFVVLLLPLSIFFVYGDVFFSLWLPTENAHDLYILSIITIIPYMIHGTIETAFHVYVITNKLKKASFWGIFIALLNFVLVIVLCQYSSFGIYSIPIAAMISGAFSHLTFTPLYAAHCLNESKWFFYKEIFKGLGGFAVLVGITYLWRWANWIAPNNWFHFVLNCFLIGIILLVVTLFIRFDRQSIKAISSKLKRN